MWIAGIALLLALAVCAWRYAGAHPRHRAVAIFVTADLVSNLGGQVLIRINGPSTGLPRVGLARFVFHLGEVCYLYWPLALAALAFAVFLEPDDARPALRVLGGLSVSFLAVLFVLYPAVRGAARQRLYLVAELAALAAAAAAGVAWFRRREPPTLTDASVLLFASLQIGAVLHFQPSTGWDTQRFFYDTAFAVLVLLHVAGELWERRTA